MVINQMIPINKQWIIIKQLFFYGTIATQFTYNTNNQINPNCTCK